MKALTITDNTVTHQALLEMAKSIPGAWVGIRIAAILLILDGWKSSKVARLFDLSRWSMVKWIKRTNNEGVAGLRDKRRPGRPSRINEKISKDLEEALCRKPEKFGLKRKRWDGIVVVEYLERFHGVHLNVRQAQRWIRRLGFTLQRPIHKYVQATSEGVKEFRETIKKTSGYQKKQ